MQFRDRFTFKFPKIGGSIRSGTNRLYFHHYKVLSFESFLAKDGCWTISCGNNQSVEAQRKRWKLFSDQTSIDYDDTLVTLHGESLRKWLEYDVKVIQYLVQQRADATPPSYYCLD